MPACPKCGKPDEPAAVACASCGVILSKARVRVGGPPGRPAADSRPQGEAPPPVSFAGAPSTSPLTAILKVAVMGAIAVAALVTLNRTPAKSSNPPPAAAPSIEAATLVSEPVTIPILSPPEGNQSKVSAADWSFLEALASRLQAPSSPPPTPDELARLERIFAGVGGDPRMLDFLFAAWMRRAEYDLRARAFAQVDLSVEKLKELDRRRPQIYELAAQSKVGQSDWAGAALAAETYDSLGGPSSLPMSLTLAASLLQLNRQSEAMAVLGRKIFDSCASVSDPQEANACAAARQIRESVSASSPAPPGGDRPREALNVSASKQQIQSDRFDVRFDGENQSGVARDVLFVLDRAYVRLAEIYDERPARKIPVVLHSAQDYFTATGAPFWSGGVYSTHNGSIQIPIRGLPSTLPREMEDVLVHELSHAFVDEMSGGFAGRDTQEGLAQYMEGKRIEEELGAAELKRLANSGRQTVMSFYMLSLAVWQQLVQSRGQGAINSLLRAMRERGSEEAAFQKVFGQSDRAMKTQVLETFWRRYS